MIPIRNVYYMLCYAFKALQQNKFRKLETENFENAQDLFAAVLITAMEKQLNRGLKAQYLETEEAVSVPKGKMNISKSLKTMSLQRSQVVCDYDEFSVDCTFNRILKTTFGLLMKADIKPERKKKIRNLLGYFKEVNTLDPKQIQWHFQFGRLDEIYRMMLAVCELTVKGLLQSQNEGRTKMAEFLDEQQMSALYEKFLLGFFRKHHPDLKISASEIPWSLDNENTALLPVMRSDIMLEKGNQILIIDAKYYQQNLQINYDKFSVHSGNLYQIFTYVKNKDAQVRDQGIRTAGMLLYAKTEAEIQPDQEYRMDGNVIEVRSLDLNADFSEVQSFLDSICEKYFQAG